MSVEEERVKPLNDCGKTSGDYVLYWMQSSQRTELNHALELAAHEANLLRTPLIVVFCLAAYPEAMASHYRFMLEGLQEVERSLESRKVKFVVRSGSPEKILPDLASGASLAVVDRDYQRLQRKWRSQVADTIGCSLLQVESNVVVPIETASEKEQYSAGTIRPRIHRHLDVFMHDLPRLRMKESSLTLDLDSMDISDTAEVIRQMKLKTDAQQPSFKGGTSSAKRIFSEFLRSKIDGYADLRNDPSLDFLSNMSPFLHFGQISPLYLAMAAQESGSPGGESFVEELVVRRELAMNFVYYNESYESIKCLPNWALATLEDHAGDAREHIYTRHELESANTHDIYWNAAQEEMVHTGKMHGYMRMYWGKKILEWSKSPSEAFDTATYLNNKYELDGRDPNGFAGVAWCFGKHDRAWSERPVFGKIRYMNDRGLERKFNIRAYVAKVQSRIG